MTTESDKTFTPETEMARAIGDILNTDESDAAILARLRSALAPLVHDQVGRSFESVYDIIAAGAGVGTNWLDTSDNSTGELFDGEDGDLEVAGESGHSDTYGPYVITAWYEKE